MAVLKIFAIKNRLDKRVKYAANKEKTSLDNFIDYAVNPEKTEQRLFESCLNCQNVETAYSDMMQTKKRYKKISGVLGYHFIQSFKPNEVTPSTAHNIGIEFAQKSFGNKYEVVIGTHLDKHHLHNHIVINSVSFVDGKKYHSNVQSYKELRQISDNVCSNHNLSVIKPQGKGKHYAQWKAEKENKPTIRSQIRNDIDILISQSLNFSTFITLLKKSGYSVKYGNVKHTALKPSYSQRFIRLDNLGKEYTDEAIENRILNQHVWKRHKLPSYNKILNFKGNYNKSRKITGFSALYFHYVYMLRKTIKGKATKKVNRYLLEDTIKFDRYVAQHKFILKNKITDVKDLKNTKTLIQNQIADIISKRKPLYTERRNSADEEKIKILSQQITSYTTLLKKLWHNLHMCNQIENDCQKVQANVAEVHKFQIEEKQMQQKGSEKYESRKRSR